jgi:glycogen(starch) synthase
VDNRSDGADATAAPRLRILHLAFEDRLRPGSGGGGVRTWEINRRLASRHDITVITTRYPGARRRTVDGITYHPLGLSIGYYCSIITYHLSVPFFLLRHRADLVVEDFAAPMSSVLVPLWTRDPTVAVVQWLFAAETTRRYKVPFFLVEHLGVRIQRRFIAVSYYIEDRLRAINPEAHVDVIYAGVDPLDPVRPSDRADVTAALASSRPTALFLGRLQMKEKGIDLLLCGWAAILPAERPYLIIAGDGKDADGVRRAVEVLGLQDNVVLVGPVDGVDKWKLLRSVGVLVVPSRFETFGLVAAEALVVGTPVVSFDLPSLCEVVGPLAGLQVPSFDADALAAAACRILEDSNLQVAMGTAARERGRLFDWDLAAEAQESAYLAAAARGTRRRVAESGPVFRSEPTPRFGHGAILARLFRRSKRIWVRVSQRSRPAPLEPGARRPRVLHLGFEDPRRPGAGGGSVRLYELNRRLADKFDITVVCANYRGARPWVEDGVRYTHVGLPFGYVPSLVTYFLAIPWALWRHSSDLVVEDFAAPVSSVAVPWMTRRPVVGSVQWLFARHKSKQYRIPFRFVEQIGLRAHRELIAVSSDLGDELRVRNPRAAVAVISNGLGDEAFVTRHHDRKGTLYLGRLEIAQKGLDMLIDAFSRLPGDVRGELLLAGDGPDEAAVRAMADERGVGDRVRFLGRVPPGERFDLLAQVDLVVMPSRYETFGMVAAESLAVKTPVLAFDINCLRNLVTDGMDGVLVESFNVAAFAEQWSLLLADNDRRRRLGDAGPFAVAGLRWDNLADRQAAVYRRVLRHVADSSASA